MKKILWICLYIISGTYADTYPLDRTGIHIGIGGAISGYLNEIIPVPIANVTLEYGMTSQSTVLLEHHGFLVAGTMALEYKYYLSEEPNSMYGVIGAVGGYSIDFGADIFPGVFKGSIGYAWNNIESDFSVMGDASERIWVLSLRYKF